MKKRCLFLIGIISLLLLSCNNTDNSSGKLSIAYQQYKLDNGLAVVLHQDKSDPIVAVAIQYHVGSNREVQGKTGFAHLFEHMMFQQSENVGPDEFFRKIQGAGGTLNGGTSYDGTTYYEVVPENALEMVLWMESDRMGYLTNTVTKSAFANQQNVVQNEKRERNDNQAYGHVDEVIAKNLYPPEHPYNWTVIGEMKDLFNATVDDVIQFHNKYYVPNNSTLVIAGDFDPDKVKTLVEKYFGEIPSGNEVVDMKPMPVTLSQTKKLYYEDNFARLPQLTMVWPVPEEFSGDSYALDFLAQALGSGKKSPMYRVLVKDKKLAPRVWVSNWPLELAGQFSITVNANAGTSLTETENAVFDAFKLFEKEGITKKDLEKFKAGIETEFYNAISSVLNKSFQLARYNEYAGSPGFIEQDIANIKAVTIEDIMRVYEKYIRDKPYVETSFVPRGQAGLAVENSIPADVVEENISDATEVDQSGIVDNENIKKTKTSFDRSVEPPVGPDPEIALPQVWTGETANGMKIWGIEQDELPLVQYSIVIDGGHLLETKDKAGEAEFLANMLTEGTANKTPEELEEAIDMLGARISVRSGTESMSLQVNCLTRNFDSTLALVEEILLQPRWDEEQFGLIKSQMLNSLKRNQANPNYLANTTFDKLVFGDNCILSVPEGGTPESVGSVTMDDLKDFYHKSFSPSVTRMHVVGQINKDKVMAALGSLTANWKPFKVDIPKITTPEQPAKSVIYFVDLPNAKQSVINIGCAAIPETDNDFYPATVMNYKLGGSFNGIVNLILREDKGYTYGARTEFAGGKDYGTFQASSSVRSDATLESVEIFKEEMEKYIRGIDENGLQFTKDALMKSNARRFETLSALHNMLRSISAYDLPVDYVKNEEAFVRSLTLEQHKALAQKYIDPSRMYYVVVGDAKTQLDGLKAVGLGKPILME